MFDSKLCGIVIRQTARENRNSLAVSRFFIHVSLSFVGQVSRPVPLFGGSMSRSSRWPYIRAQAWNRDKKARAVCHICGEPIDYFVPPSSTPDSYEPDHIIPVHMRPDLELDITNIKASHRRCNRQRGDGTNGTNIIGERSRKW